MKKLMTTVLVGALAVGAVPIAASAMNQSGGDTYTGCVNDNSGKIKHLTAGSAPLEPCADGHTEITLGSGDISAVLAGTGLLGGATGGEATLSLAPGYRLPQGCANGQVAEWDGSGAWGCTTVVDSNTDEFGKYAFTVGIGNLTVIGPTLCADHGSFTNSNEHIANQPPITIPAGRYLVVPDDVRWDIEQYKDINDADVFPYGIVDITLFDHDANQAVTSWRRSVDLNTWGNEHFEPGTFVSDGGEYHMQYLVNAGACTESQLEGGFSFIRVG